MDGHNHIHQEMGFKKNDGKCDLSRVQCVIMEAQDQICQTESMESLGEDSGNNSTASTSSSELEEDASSSSPTSSESLSSQYGPLYALSELMNHLPIKTGLSNHYQGKSQSYTSLANVKSLEDLAKKVGPYSHRLKSRKSYGGLEGHKFGPKAIIAKKFFKGSSFSSSLSNRGNILGSFRHTISLQRDC